MKDIPIEDVTFSYTVGFDFADLCHVLNAEFRELYVKRFEENENPWIYARIEVTATYNHMSCTLVFNGVDANSKEEFLDNLYPNYQYRVMNEFNFRMRDAFNQLRG